MTKRRFILGFLIVGVSAALYFYLTRDREPRYNGIPLSIWLQQYQKPASIQEKAAAASAIQQIGTNSIDYLLEKIRYEDPAWLSILASTMQRLKITTPTLDRFRSRKQDAARQAVEGFRVLGPQARPAIPALIQLLCNNKHPWVAERSSHALARIGEPAVRPMMIELSNAPSALKCRIILALGEMESNAIPAIPVLTQYAQTNDVQVLRASIRALGLLHCEAPIVMPVLTNACYDQNLCVRLIAMQAAGQFAEKARPYTNTLVSLLSDPSFACRTTASNTLQSIAPELLTNTPPR